MVNILQIILGIWVLLLIILIYNLFTITINSNPQNDNKYCIYINEPYGNKDIKSNETLDDPTLSWYYYYKPKGNIYYFGKKEAPPPPTLKPGANTIKRPGNAYLLDYPKNTTKSYITTVRLLTAPSCRMSKLESAFWNTKKEVQGMGQIGEMIDFKVELYDIANPANLKYKLPIVVKEIPGNPPTIMKFNDLLYGPRSDVMIQWIYGDGRLY